MNKSARAGGDGDAPAAMRYTEVRLARIAGELLADIDREYDDREPLPPGTACAS